MTNIVKYFNIEVKKMWRKIFKTFTLFLTSTFTQLIQLEKIFMAIFLRLMTWKSNIASMPPLPGVLLNSPLFYTNYTHSVNSSSTLCVRICEGRMCVDGWRLFCKKIILWKLDFCLKFLELRFDEERAKSF